MLGRIWVAGALALAWGGACVGTAAAGTLSRTPLEVKGTRADDASDVGKTDAASWFVKVTWTSKYDTDPDTRLPLTDDKSRTSKAAVGRTGSHIVRSTSGSELLNVEWEGGVAWTEDLKGEEDGWGFAGSLILSLPGEDRWITPFVSAEPELAFKDGSRDGTLGATLEAGLTLKGKLPGGLELEAQPALQWVESDDRDSRTQSQLIRVTAKLKKWEVTFKAKGNYQDTDYDALRTGMTVKREDETLDAFVGVDLAEKVKSLGDSSVLKALSALEVGATYAERDSNSDEDGADFVEWRFAPTVTFKF